ncbi:hypothetical protein CTA1_7172 [Colletotrichum tanaceti]|uniref:Uncharacterized protein n=1 Tax=Colletotrichum tanaceti TaxID=1306861 RepID=A0A4U6WZV9_9PEZI|nr:hypothetical protein CTA1_7172 [Colletotrichum tanaceti]
MSLADEVYATPRVSNERSIMSVLIIMQTPRRRKNFPKHIAKHGSTNHIAAELDPSLLYYRCPAPGVWPMGRRKPQGNFMK